MTAFGDVRFNIQSGELHRDGRTTRLTPKAAAVLVALLEKAPGLVTKQELLNRVWGGRAVGDEAITSCIQEVRRALDDDARNPRYIETRYRRGYRLLAALDAKSFANGPDPLGAGAPILALPDKPSIAVLPFLNMTGDPEQDYFTDGVTEDIITELSRFHSLFVIARNSSFSYKGKSSDVRQIGRELGVRYVLEGSVRKSSNRIRVSGQLIDTLTGNHLWAERYDRVLEDIFTVQEELTRAIVAAIAPQIESVERLKAIRPRPSNLSAYEIALRAAAHAQDGHYKADRTLLDQSVREAKEALAIDPNCVRALHALAGAHCCALFHGMAADREHVIQEAMRAVMRVIELDSADARSYSLRALAVMLGVQWDRYPEALLDARRAHEMNPNDTTVLRHLGTFEAITGEPDRGIEHLHQVMRLNPRDRLIYDTYQNLASACFLAKRYADGIDWASRALRERPQMLQSHSQVVLNFVGLGEIGKAKASFETLKKMAPTEYLRSRLEGTWVFGRSEDRRRATTFLRIAAGLENPSSAAAL